MILRILATAAVAVLAACSNNEPKPAEPAPGDEVTFDLVGTRWALKDLGGKVVTVSDGGREAYLALNSDQNSVVGFAGCNRISSTYKLDAARLSFGEVVATRMFCQDMPIETVLLEVMKATAAWRISGWQLELLDANQRILARFEARNLY